MSQVCNKCSRINPSDAVYCYWDGALLQGHTANGGPVNPGVLPFPNPFVFPSGQSCQNFDQLAMACQNYWKDAIDLLKKGFLGGFFGGLGRADLAMAAQEAAQFPDQDRGLDQLLAKLPSRALEAPKLKAEPLEVNLGIVPMGSERTFEIHLANNGMRLLFGSIASDSKWMTIGEGPGQNQKIFQFRDEIVIPVQIRGKELRAGPKPLVGHLFIDSNGGNQLTVTVQLEVPVKPLAVGVLAGATTPRQVAEKAKSSPKDAAVLFENGTVANWFSENGWIYPVQGPAASGLGAVQQFFEALGLAKAPKVVIGAQSLSLQGTPGQSLQTTLEVRTDEKRPVYAHASANEPWLDVSQVKHNGRFAIIHVRIPNVPYRPGETLQAKIRVAANGNQRFEVPLNLAVLGGPNLPWAPAPVYPVTAAEPVMAVPGEPIMAIPAEPFSPGPITAAPVQAIQAVPAASAAPVYPGHSYSAEPVAAVAAVADPNDPFSAFAIGSAPAGQTIAATPMTRVGGRGKRQESSLAIHILPLFLLILALIGTVVKDLFLGTKGPEVGGIPIEKHHHIGVGFDYPFFKDHKGGDSLRFGVWKYLNPGDKDSPVKNLTFTTTGISNSTVVRVDGQDSAFGDQSDGKWETNPIRFGKYGGAKGLWVHHKNIQVTQIVEKIPGDPFIENGKLKRAIDTCFVRYEIANKDKVPHTVGLRVLWDTLIGSRDNDGVPFTVAGENGLVDTQKGFVGADQVPDFVQALEKPDLKNPGVVVRLKLKNPGLEGPTKLLLTRWPDAAQNDRKKLYEWEIELVNFNEGRPDSCAVIYWDPQPLQPGKTRVVGFTYGLVHLVEGAGGLGATISGDFAPNKKITITAYISNPQAEETVTLKLKDGLKLMAGSQATQPVPLPQGALTTNPNPITWNIEADRTGEFVISVTSNKNRSVDLTLNISAKGVFGGS